MAVKIPDILAFVPSKDDAVTAPDTFASPSTSNFDVGDVEFIPRLPLAIMLTFSVPAVKKVNASSSDPAEDSALI